MRADQQSGGRGRLGRAWVSPPGNLHASTFVRPHTGDPPPATLALVAAVALDELVAAHVDPARLRIKWPNDLMLHDGAAWAKLAGILLEASVDAVVVGIGVNLAHHPQELDRATTSLAAATGAAPDPARFAEDLAASFARWLARWRGAGLAAVRARWLARAHPLGTPLAVHRGDGQVLHGLFDGLDADGALRLRADDATLTIHAGDVALL